MSKSQHICLSLFLCLTAVTFAQVDPALAGPALGGGRIKLDVVVTDKQGKPVSGLALKDFTLLDNGQPGEILSFHDPDGAVQPSDPPIEMILVIDTINLPIEGVIYIRHEVERFLRRNDGHLALPISVFVLTKQGVGFQHQASLDGNELAAEMNEHANKLSPVLPSQGVNGEIELFKVSVDTLISIVNSERRKPGRKLLVWAGHGWPILDSLSIESSPKTRQQYFDVIVELSTRLREARIPVYSISPGHPGNDTFLHEAFIKGVKSPEKASIPNLALRVLAIQSGGRVMGPDNDVAGQIDICIQDASAFYSIAFDPPRATLPNEYHDLKVQIDQPGLTARTNTGYYNQP